MSREQLSMNFGSPTGRELGDAGMAQALAHAEAVQPDWAETVLKALRVYAQTHRRFPLEQFRMDAAGLLPEPASHHAWGSIARLACERGILRFTGRYQPAKSTKTHGHDVRIYARIA